jgi:hypothetical protein
VCAEPILKNNKTQPEESMSETATTLSVQKLVALEAILRGGALCGVLDITAAFIVYGYFGAKPLRLLQGIASGLLGSKAYDGGLLTALVGLCSHFFIAFTASSVYVLLSRRASLLGQYAYVSGALYGVAVYFFMQHIVIPLSAANRRPFSVKMMVIGVVIHIFCVGLPISLATRRYFST